MVTTRLRAAVSGGEEDEGGMHADAFDEIHAHETVVRRPKDSVRDTPRRSGRRRPLNTLGSNEEHEATIGEEPPVNPSEAGSTGHEATAAPATTADAAAPAASAAPAARPASTATASPAPAARQAAPQAAPSTPRSGRDAHSPQQHLAQRLLVPRGTPAAAHTTSNGRPKPRSGGGSDGGGSGRGGAKRASSERRGGAVAGGDSKQEDEELDLSSDAVLDRLAASIEAALCSRAGSGAAVARVAPAPASEAVAASAAANGSQRVAVEGGGLHWQPAMGLQPLAPSALELGAAAAQQATAALCSAAPPRLQMVAAYSGGERGKGSGGGSKGGSKGGAAGKGGGGGRGDKLETAGPKWYDLPATAITDEVKRDLRLLHLRSAYDSKRFYKSLDSTKFPKYFQFGTVLPDALDGLGGRLSSQERNSSLAQQLLADADVAGSSKKRYLKLQEQAQRWVKAKKRKTSLPRSKPSKHRPKH